MAQKTMDYRHRPAKNIERHLLIEACRRVLAAYPAHRKKFQYVGFGALEFLDFQLVHRALGIEQMISIEKKRTARHEFNKPFKSIKIIEGHSNHVLPGGEIDLKRPTIIWLDSMDGLNKSVIEDLVTLGRTLSAPSFLIVTINAHPVTPESERLNSLSRAVGSQYVPPGTTDGSLAKDGLAIAQRTIIEEVLKEAVLQRRDPVQWMQTMNFQYRDGAVMQTVAGMIVPQSMTRRDVDQVFSDIDFYRPGSDYIDLRVPVITVKERVLLDRQLPKGSKAPLLAKSIPKDDLIAYRQVYRYLHLAGLQSAVETSWTA